MENTRAKLARKSDYNLIIRLKSAIKTRRPGSEDEQVKFVRMSYKELPASRFYADSERFQGNVKSHTLTLRDTKLTVKGTGGKILSHTCKSQEEANDLYREITGLAPEINTKVLSTEDTKSQLLDLIPEDQRVTCTRYKSPHDAALRLKSLCQGTRSKDSEVKIIDDTKNITKESLGFVKSQAIRTLWKNGRMISTTHRFQLIGSTIKVDPISQMEDYEDFSSVFISEYKAAEYWTRHIGAEIMRGDDKEVVVELDRNHYPTLEVGQLIKLNTKEVLLVTSIEGKLVGISLSGNGYTLELDRLSKKLDLLLKSSYISVLEIRKADLSNMIKDSFASCEKVWSRKSEIVVFNGLQFLKEEFMSAILCITPVDEELIKELRKDEDIN